MEHIHEIAQTIEFLKAAISPVAMVSGVGLLLLTLSNRLGRTIDRARSLHREVVKESSHINTEAMRSQIPLLYTRSNILRFSIIFLLLSVLSSSIIIVCLFLSMTAILIASSAIYFFFGLAILFLLISVLLFIIDLVLALRAIRMEVGVYLNESRRDMGRKSLDF